VETNECPLSLSLSLSLSLFLSLSLSLSLFLSVSLSLSLFLLPIVYLETILHCRLVPEPLHRGGLKSAVDFLAINFQSRFCDLTHTS
jgi:hypothetical protein